MPKKWNIVAWALAASFALGCQRFTSVPLKPADSAGAFLGRSLNDPGLREFMTATAGEQAQWPRAQWDFPHLTLAAFYFQPGLEVWRAQWKMAQAAERTAAGRLNPVLNVAPGYSMNAPAGLNPWLPLVTVDIPIETAGKRDLRKLRAAQLAAAGQLAVNTAAWQARSHLRTALLDLTLNERRAALLEQQLQFQNQTVEILQQRFAAGAASAFEANAGRTARLRLEADAADARLRATAARAQLAEVIGLPLSALDGIKLLPIQLGPPEQMDALLAPVARDRALQSRSDLLGLLAEYAASETALRLEIARQYPDIHVTPGYQFDQGEHKWSLGLSVELPLLNQNQGPIAEAEAKRKETAARFLALQAQIISGIDQAASELKILRQQRTRAENLLELQRQQRDATEAAFKAGDADRLELTAAQVEATLTELTAADLEARQIAALGRLEDALQQDPATMNAVEKATSLAERGHD